MDSKLISDLVLSYRCCSLHLQLTECPDQHSANLWQKFLGAKTEIRYICYTKEDKVRDAVRHQFANLTWHHPFPLPPLLTAYIAVVHLLLKRIFWYDGA